jgi:hypothetical protein
MTKPKKCAVRTCRQPYTPRRAFETWCSPDCALTILAQRKAKLAALLAKREREALRVRKLQLKPLTYWENRAQIAVNALRREIDRDQPCYTCGTYEADEWHAGHWISRGASSYMRYDYQRNIRKQCSRCNTYLGGNSVEFRKHLVEELGPMEVIAMECAPKSIRRTREELQEIEAKAKADLKALQKERA